MRRFKKQAGFTLVEIAIVLVIVGILLGGVLQGQQMIENSRIKGVVNDMNGVSAASNAYFDRYRALPGDEAAATMQARGWGAGLAGGDGNGVLQMAFADTWANAGGAGNEQAGFWQALRSARFLPGAPAAIGVAALPRSSTGGLIGVVTGAYTQPGVSICASGLTHRQALGIDTLVDGPLPETSIGNNVGAMRGAIGAAPFNPAAANPGGVAFNESLATVWTMCRAL